MVQTVKQFLADAYQLVSASTPTSPLQGYDMSDGLNILNRLVTYYSATGLMLTIAKEVVYNLPTGQSLITFGQASYTPTPNVTVGRLANLNEAWLLLDGVTYPLICESRDVFQESYKYDPQLGLPRFVIFYPQTDLTTLRLYPGPSQGYEVHIYGKYQLDEFTENDTMAALPAYYNRFFQFAVAKDLSRYKGRTKAWSQDLESDYREAKAEMEAVSNVNLVIQSENESLLNGSWRVRSGV